MMRGLWPMADDRGFLAGCQCHEDEGSDVRQSNGGSDRQGIEGEEPPRQGIILYAIPPTLVSHPDVTADRRDPARVEKVDLTIGMYAEPLPQGFGFSDTAFRVFILMASRRLKSDRFFTMDYRPEVYTQAGIDWVERNTTLAGG